MAVRKITIRRGTASSWTSSNPTLSGGEMGYETDTGKMKIGTGTTPWTSLAYFSTGAGGGASDLDDLTDVSISAPQYGQVLKYSGTEWYNDALLLDNIGLVNTAGASNGDVLTYSNGYWIADAPSGGTAAPSTPHPFAMLV